MQQICVYGHIGISPYILKVAKSKDDNGWTVNGGVSVAWMIVNDFACDVVNDVLCNIE